MDTLQQIVQYWYLTSPSRFLNATTHAIHMLDGKLAVRDTLRNINKPLFQDYTTQGRIIGFFLRLARVAAALLVYAVVVSAYAAVFVFWIIFPLVCLVSLVGSLVGQ